MLIETVSHIVFLVVKQCTLAAVNINVRFARIKHFVCILFETSQMVKAICIKEGWTQYSRTVVHIAIVVKIVQIVLGLDGGGHPGSCPQQNQFVLIMQHFLDGASRFIAKSSSKVNLLNFL